MDDFAVTVTLPILWGDMDALGHVNNVRYLRWFESARIAYFEAVGLAAESPRGIGPILATTTIDFLMPLHYPGEVLVGASTDKLGRSSFTMRYAVALASDPLTVAAKGTAVVVTMDYGAGETVPVPDAVRDAIASVEIPRFDLWRLDDSGNEVRVRGFFTEDAAEAEAARFTALGHKQAYWVTPRD